MSGPHRRGTTPGAGGATPSGTWNNLNTFWNSNSGGGAGTLTTDIGAGNVGVFAASNDATGAYTVTIPDPNDPNYVAVNASGFRVEEGTVTIAGHPSRDLDPKTQASILKQAGLK